LDQSYIDRETARGSVPASSLGLPALAPMASSSGFLTRAAGFIAIVLSLVAFAWFLALAKFALPPTAAALAVGVLVGTLGAVLWRSRSWSARLVALPLILAVAIGAIYLGTSARNDRHWRIDDSRTPSTEIAGDVATIHNFRNFDWTSATTANPRWETRSVHLSNLRGVDFIMVYWEGWDNICHTMLSFDFGPEGYICASVDARLEEGESYSPIAGAFRAYDILYVFGDERDVVRLRTNFRKNDVYIYRLKATPERARELFTGYLNRANELRDRPAWYNSLTTNCTTTIRYHAQLLNIENPWSWKVLANGHLDSFFHEHGRLAGDLPLAEIRARSLATPAAQTAPLADFSTAIRANRPKF
jgi:hypothetical protein